MNVEGYRSRIIDEKVEQYLRTFGAVCIEGPKWCGKTWTSLFHSKSGIFIGDPDGGFGNRRMAEMSPSLVLEGVTPRLIDEWQEVPSLWDAVRFKVDERGEKGQFILTGSATPNHKGVLHSGAGRIARMRMRPMSLYESGDSSGQISLRQLCHGELEPCMTGSVDLMTITKLIVRGGWPESTGMPVEDAALLLVEYLKAVIDDDVFRVDGIKRDKRKMEKLLRSLARNESTTAAISTLVKDVRENDETDIDRNSVTTYLDIFKRLFLTDNQPPFSQCVRSSVRVKQSEKRHLADPSLACALMNLTPERLLWDLETLGFLFEALCERDLRIYAESFDAKLYHYQDYSNKEIDAVIELKDGGWCAFEIKLGANQIDRAAANLLNIRNSFEKEGAGHAPSILCVICGLVNAAYQRPDGVYVVPVTSLRP